jgi:hypothetical protein
MKVGLSGVGTNPHRLKVGSSRETCGDLQQGNSFLE